MAVTDIILKQLISNGAPAFAAWLLHAEVENVEALPGELPFEAVHADAVFRVQLASGAAVVLHVEFQGRSSHRPMPWRMLDYMVRLALKHQLPIHSAVLYVEQGSGSEDTGRHDHPAGDGTIALAWTYQVIHLWRMQAEDLLALGRRNLLPLIGLTQIDRPAETMPRVVSEIRAEPDERQQVLLLTHLVALLTDEEVFTMTQRLISDLDLEDLKRHPALWQTFQRWQRETLRDNVLEVLVARFNPLASDYRKVERKIAAIEGIEHLRDLLRHAAQVADFEAFAALLESTEKN